MRAVIQRVLRAKVEVEGRTVGQIGNGILAYVSVGKEDTDGDAEWVAGKIAELRIFPDDEGKMNVGALEAGAQVLAVSNFTLHGDCRKGRRPGFDGAAEPVEAQRLYEMVCKCIQDNGLQVERGVFGAHMHVESVNDGPVTFIIDSGRAF
jgi:D-tyrosyl-tRNA(Tyr) deacylase